MSNKKRTWSAHRSSSTGDPGDRGYAGDSRYHFPSQGDGRGYFPRDVYVSSEYDRGQRSYRNYDRPPYFNQPDVPAQRGFQSWDRVSDFDYPWPGDSSHAFGDGYYDRFPSSRRMPISARYPYDTSREKMGSTIYDKRYDANVDYRRQPLPPSDYGFAESFHHSSVRPVSNYPSSSSSSWRNVWNQTSNGHNPRSNLWYAKPFSKTFPMRHLRKLQQIKHRDKVEKNATESSNGEEGGSFRELSDKTVKDRLDTCTATINFYLDEAMLIFGRSIEQALQTDTVETSTMGSETGSIDVKTLTRKELATSFSDSHTPNDHNHTSTKESSTNNRYYDSRSSNLAGEQRISSNFSGNRHYNRGSSMHRTRPMELPQSNNSYRNSKNERSGFGPGNFPRRFSRF